MDLPEKVRLGIVDLAKKYDIDEVILFGSRARGDIPPAVFYMSGNLFWTYFTTCFTTGQNIILFHNGLQHLRVAVHNSKIVVIFGSQLLCQGVANLAKPCNDNFHASSSCTFCLLAQGRMSILKIHRTFKKI